MDSYSIRYVDIGENIELDIKEDIVGLRNAVSILFREYAKCFNPLSVNYLMIVNQTNGNMVTTIRCDLNV